MILYNIFVHQQELPKGFWRQHIRMAADESTTYLTIDENTFEITVAKSKSKIWVEHG